MRSETYHTFVPAPVRSGGDFRVTEFHRPSITQVDIDAWQEALKPSAVPPKQSFTQVDILAHMEQFAQQNVHIKDEHLPMTQPVQPVEPINQPVENQDIITPVIIPPASQAVERAPERVRIEPIIEPQTPRTSGTPRTGREDYSLSRERRKAKPRSGKENWLTLPKKFRVGLQHAATIMGLAAMTIAGLQGRSSASEADLYVPEPIVTQHTSLATRPVAVATRPVATHTIPTAEPTQYKTEPEAQQGQEKIEAGEVDYYMEALGTYLTMQNEDGESQPLTFIVKDEQSPDIEKADSGVSVRIPVKPGVAINAIHGYNKGVFEHGYAAVAFVQREGVTALVDKLTEKQQGDKLEQYKTHYAAIISARQVNGDFIRAYDILNIPEVSDLYSTLRTVNQVGIWFGLMCRLI